MASHLAERERAELPPLRLYLNQAAQTRLLTPEEEKGLAAQIRQGQAAQATLLSTAQKHLTRRLQLPPVRKALRDLRALITPSLLRRALELNLLQGPGGVGEAMTDQALLEAAFAVAAKKLQLRHGETLDSERREAQQTLLDMTRFTEEVLLGLAKRLITRAQQATWEQQEELARQGEKARDQLVLANLLLVVAIAQRGQFCWGGLSLLDRIQEGNLGLLRAVDGFDPACGTRFSTYATPCIVHAIDRALKQQAGVIRRPDHVHVLVTQIRRALQHCESEQGQGTRLEAGMAELQLTDRDRVTIRLALRSQSVQSLLFENGEERGNGPRDGVDDEAAASEAVQLFRDRVCSLLRVLTEREAQVVTMRLGLDGSEPKIQRQIGELFGITRARAQQIEVQAIAKLQAAAGRRPNGMAKGAAIPRDRPRGQLTHASYASLFQVLTVEADLGARRLPR